MAGGSRRGRRKGEDGVTSNLPPRIRRSRSQESHPRGNRTQPSKYRARSPNLPPLPGRAPDAQRGAVRSLHGVPQAAGQLAGSDRSARTQPAPRRPPVSNCHSGRAPRGGVRRLLPAGSRGHVTSPLARSRSKWVTGRWGSSHLTTPTPRPAASTAPPVLCQRLGAALPAGIPEDSTATSLRPRGWAAIGGGPGGEEAGAGRGPRREAGPPC